MIITGKKFSKPAMSRVINGDTALPEEVAPEEKVRLDVLLTEKYKSYNRSTLQKFIKAGFVTVDGEKATKPNQKFSLEAKLELVVPEEQKNADLKPEVIYEDEKVLVVNKPAGLLSVAKGGYCPEKTLEDYGLVVHRLDRDTSGVMILAKDEETQKFLQNQFKDRKTQKTYFAVVEGRPKLDAARIDLPIARDLKRKATFRVDPAGRPSETFYRVLKSNNERSLLELRPTTGRTHQLRVHLKYLGHPIVGDKVYGEARRGDPDAADPWKTGNFGRADLTSERLYLHAGALEITLPSGERREFKVEMPKEFEELVKS